MTSLQGKWAFVTGASRGVGAHLANGLAQLGCNLVLHSRDLSHTADLAAQLRATGVSVVTVAAELADPAQIAPLLDSVQAAAQIDILYNNAAIQVAKQKALWQTSPQDLRRSLEVNLVSLICICDRLAPPMVARGWGRIVNLTSRALLISQNRRPMPSQRLEWTNMCVISHPTCAAPEYR